MDQKIQLKHPADKKAVSIDKGKYNVLREAILRYLKTNGESTHAEISQSISEDFNKDKIKFEGSIAWYIEWVKLDLEAGKEIKRNNDKPVKFMINKV